MATSFLGLDIGGQTIKGIRLDDSGAVTMRAVRRTPAAEGAGAVLDAIRDAVSELLGPGPVAAVGVGTPGGVDSSGLIVGEAANIPGWMGTALGREVEAASRAPCGVRNDGNLAAYAEWASRGGASRALLFVGMGTGIGGGFVEDGRMMGGCDDRALEIGHIVIEPDGRLCACGIRGCLEAYASGLSIGRLAHEYVHGFSSPLATLAGSDAKLSARDVYEAYARGDELAIKVNSIVADALARGIAAGLAFLAPDCVVLGGGVMAGAGNLVAEVAEAVKLHVYPAAWRQCRFEAALCGHEAGLLGAALYGASLVMHHDSVLALAHRANDRLRDGESLSKL